jgi:hypothetical protein
VTNVYIRSTAWTSAFLNYLASSGEGDATLGYRIPTGSPAQFQELIWGNLNQVSITFSENVNVTDAALAVTGVNIPAYAIAGFTHSGNTATWTLSGAITSDAARLTLAASGVNAVTDLAGNALDGEWSGGVSTTSGNGTVGGDFIFDVNALAGDMDRSGAVDGGDFDIWFTHLLSATFEATEGDLNGDGLVDGGDYDIWFTHLLQTAPPQVGPGASTGTEIVVDSVSGPAGTTTVTSTNTTATGSAKDTPVPLNAPGVLDPISVRAKAAIDKVRAKLGLSLQPSQNYVPSGRSISPPPHSPSAEVLASLSASRRDKITALLQKLDDVNDSKIVE